ncbi:hypothetical protein CC86DRAFT_368848 [Ophiobolus disseminans]|uniref:Secreted protein n=1 Tax=Ophiobolus disseminans TaxID=1469910 RepID=A0A6A7A691_9PLEO|nr:hypothetical protein CC86DRAFT_368848 [Ophiobolus disseminans]
MLSPTANSRVILSLVLIYLFSTGSTELRISFGTIFSWASSSTVASRCPPPSSGATSASSLSPCGCRQPTTSSSTRTPLAGCSMSSLRARATTNRRRAPASPTGTTASRGGTERASRSPGGL